MIRAIFFSILTVTGVGASLTLADSTLVTTDTPIIGSGYSYQPPTFSPPTVVTIETVRQPPLLSRLDGRFHGRFRGHFSTGRVVERVQREVIIVPQIIIREEPADRILEEDLIARPGSVVNLLLK